MNVGEIEARVAREARRLLDNLEHPPSVELGQGLQALLGHHRPDLYDGPVQPTIRVEKNLRLQIRGLMVWSKDRWAEVFGADLTLAEDRDVLLDYTLYFGRQDAPGRKVAVEQRGEILPELRKTSEWTWAQIFSKVRR